MDNLYNFINNFRAGIDNANKQANTFLNQAGQELGNAWNQGWSAAAAPFVSAGNQIGNAIGQMFSQPSNNTTVGTPNAGVQTVQQNTNTPAATQAAPQQQGQTYYYRDPAIDTFVNTLRFISNPLRGITGWTPLDAVNDMVSDSMYSAFGKKYEAPQVTKTTTTETTEEKPEEKKEEETDEGETITYTYKPGDTFGQVIKDLGLGTANGLWGNNGDVEYYTKQLVDQGIWPSNIPGNIPIGTTIKLKRRK